MTANRKAYLDANHHIEVRKEETPRPGRGEALVAIKANGICGSDIHFFHEGWLGNFVVTKPYLPGHEASGEVVEAGEGVADFKPGDRVVIEPGIPCGRCRHCRGGRYNLCPDVVFLSAPPVDGTFCDFLTIRADMLHRMPEGMSFAMGALAEPAAVAVHAVNRGAVRNGETAAILGCGPIGLLTLQAFKAAGGGRAFCVDTIASRRKMAEELGAEKTFDPSEAAEHPRDAAEHPREAAEHPREAAEHLRDAADVVFETAGSATATAAAFGIARAGGRVVQVGWPEKTHVALDVAGFIEKELDYIAVNRYANAFPAAIAWLADGRIRGDILITHRFPFDQVAEAFQFALDNKADAIKVMVIN
ncbi:MAG: NAD(P)-dependent alcohol dehydrogenase [Candidatus Sumerlaeota bacterium]|nr:NAD(P)-dependent alcohol dehydrogenase [Candidatus Sumerlaeota bacterium]